MGFVLFRQFTLLLLALLDLLHEQTLPDDHFEGRYSQLNKIECVFVGADGDLEVIMGNGVEVWGEKMCIGGRFEME